MFNPSIYPNDNFAKGMINKLVEVYQYIEDNEYLNLVKEYENYSKFFILIFKLYFCSNIKEALNEFSPDLIIYNAGTDILFGDPIGKLNISDDGIKSRDEIVFKFAKDFQLPVVMLLRFVFFSLCEVMKIIFMNFFPFYSGGYKHSNAEIIGDSIINLYDKNLIHEIKSIYI
jgi:histone deacetylase 11